MQHAGVDVELKLYPGETHTSPLIENPMRGGRVRGWGSGGVPVWYCVGIPSFILPSFAWALLWVGIPACHGWVAGDYVCHA